jgi:hypothetical protein
MILLFSEIIRRLRHPQFEDVASPWRRRQSHRHVLSRPPVLLLIVRGIFKLFGSDIQGVEAMGAGDEELRAPSNSQRQRGSGPP